MGYYLQSTASGRVFIDSKLHDGNILEKAIAARNWGDARDKVQDGAYVPVWGHGFFKEGTFKERDHAC